MKSNTQVLSAGSTFVITESMGILQFALIGLSDTSQFSYLGQAPVLDNTGAPITPSPIPFTGQVAYNSRLAVNAATPWTQVVIEVSVGAIGLELLQN